MNLKIKREITKMTRYMYDRQMVNTYEGNVSIRKGDRVFVTPGGISKGKVKARMIVEMDLDGNVVCGKYQPSSEVKLHLEIYRLRNDITSVIHNHSPYATAFAIARKPVVTKAYPEMIVLFDKIPLIEYGTPGTKEVYTGIKKYIDKTDTFLLANHGLVAGGKNIWDAFNKVESIEKTAKTLVIAGLLGGEHPIEDEKLRELYRMRLEMFGKEEIKL